MLHSRFQTGEDMCDVCEKNVAESYNLWHPNQNWSGVWLTLCEECLDAMEVNL